ncbi:MAG: YCF48-related protein [Bacteroidota bacterium]|nr:YCF48-related protein [Bacteroidota bacterium]
MKTSFFTLTFILFTTLSFSQSGWISQNSNTNKTLNDVFFINDQKGWIVTDSSKILRTTDGGETWNMKTLPLYSPLKTIFFINENTGWAAGGYFYFAHSGVVYKTIDGGSNWFLLSHSPEIEDIYFINSNTGFAGYDGSGDFVSAGGIVKTTNGGSNWTGSFSSSYVISAVKFENSDTGFAIGNYWDDTGNDTNIIYRTINGGISWETKYKESNHHFYFNNLRDICIKGNNIWVSGRDSSIMYSSNAGESWNRQFIPKPRIMESIFFINQQTGWAVGIGYPDTANIIKTTNGGMNWINLKSNYNHRLYSVIFINEYTGWTVGDYGIILKTTNGGLTYVSNILIHIPSSYVLNQNYPNPFNPSTVISYSLYERSDIKITIYNIQGKELKTLVDKNQSPGNYETTFNSSELASGIYYYSLYANGNWIETRKMSLLK